MLVLPVFLTVFAVGCPAARTTVRGTAVLKTHAQEKRDFADRGARISERNAELNRPFENKKENRPS